jgi:hypothetical protein
VQRLYHPLVSATLDENCLGNQVVPEECLGEIVTFGSDSVAAYDAATSKWKPTRVNQVVRYAARPEGDVSTRDCGSNVVYVQATITEIKDDDAGTKASTRKPTQYKLVPTGQEDEDAVWAVLSELAPCQDGIAAKRIVANVQGAMAGVHAGGAGAGEGLTRSVLVEVGDNSLTADALMQAGASNLVARLERDRRRAAEAGRPVDEAGDVVPSSEGVHRDAPDAGTASGEEARSTIYNVHGLGAGAVRAGVQAVGVVHKRQIASSAMPFPMEKRRMLQARPTCICCGIAVLQEPCTACGYAESMLGLWECAWK